MKHALICLTLALSFNLNAKEKGFVWFVGAGPGAADLITIRGLTILKRANVVLYDSLVEPELLELTDESNLYQRLQGSMSGLRNRFKYVYL